MLICKYLGYIFLVMLICKYLGYIFLVKSGILTK